jgi:DNA-binding LacI/PurR family transcriptional regulator
MGTPPRPRAHGRKTQPIFEMAKTANALLLSLLQGPEAIRLEVLSADLLIRQSAAPLKDQ